MNNVNLNEAEHKEADRLTYAIKLLKLKREQRSYLLRKERSGKLSGSDALKLANSNVEITKIKEYIESLGRRLGRIDKLKHLLK